MTALGAVAISRARPPNPSFTREDLPVSYDRDEPRLFRRVGPDLYAVYDPATGEFSTMPAALVPPLVRADPERVRLSLTAARRDDVDDLDDEPEDDDSDPDDSDDEWTDEELERKVSFDPDTGVLDLWADR